MQRGENKNKYCYVTYSFAVHTLVHFGLFRWLSAVCVSLEQVIGVCSRLIFWTGRRVSTAL